MAQTLFIFQQSIQRRQLASKNDSKSEFKKWAPSSADVMAISSTFQTTSRNWRVSLSPSDKNTLHYEGRSVKDKWSLRRNRAGRALVNWVDTPADIPYRVSGCICLHPHAGLSCWTPWRARHPGVRRGACLPGGCRMGNFPGVGTL